MIFIQACEKGSISSTAAKQQFQFLHAVTQNSILCFTFKNIVSDFALLKKIYMECCKLPDMLRSELQEFPFDKVQKYLEIMRMEKVDLNT